MSKDLGPHMPLYLDRFLGGTMHFGADEIGAYILLIAHQWQHGHVEDDQGMIERVARCEYGRLRRVLSKFEKRGEHLVNSTCEKIRQDRDNWMADQARRAKLGGEARRQAMREPNGLPNGQANWIPKREPHTDTDTDTNIQIPKTTTTKPREDVVMVFEFSEKSTKIEIVKGLSASRDEYKTLPEARWEEAMKRHNPPHDVVIEAANVFLKADANNITPLKAPAAYFAGIIKKIMEERGLLRESLADKAARMRRGQ